MNTRHLPVFLQALLGSLRDLAPILLVITFFQLAVIGQPLPNLLDMLLGTLFVVIGLTLFVQGLELGLFPMGSPWVLLQDFHAKIFAQNLTAIFVRLAQWLADARYQHRRHGYRINFANALSKMKNNLVRLFLETSPLDLSWRLLQRMADAVVAVRPGRKFPRDMKKVRVPGFQMQYRRTR